MKFEIRHIPIWPLFKITFFVSLVLFFLIILLLGNQIMDMSSQLSGESSMGGKLTLSLLIFMSVSQAFFFSLFITAGAALYNYFSRTFGGIQFDLHGDFIIEEEIIEKQPAISQQKEE
jgi:small-conductance mechanosensitive channel